MSARHWAVIGLMITALSWAGNALIARASAGMLPPICLSFWRGSLAVPLWVPLPLRGLRQHRSVSVDNGLRVAVSAALSSPSYNTLLYQAAQSTSAIPLTLVGTGLPVSAFFWSMLLLRQVP